MEYKLWVSCRRNRILRDAGLHAKGEYSSDPEAITALMKRAQDDLFVGPHFDEVSCRIVSGERVVYRKTLYSP